MSKQKSIAAKNLKNAAALAAVIGLFIYWVSINIERASNVILALVGLGVVIFLHELGHFIAGKLSDVKVEAFAIGFGPVVLGVKKVRNFIQVRVLPTILAKKNDPSGQGLLCFRVPVRCKAGETEYQLRIFPVGGFVKLLGQEDIGADKPSDDPRSFLNKPIWKRVIVGAAGVTFNVIAAIAIFVAVFTIGIKMPPAIVGDVLAGWPAERAGLKSGDEIIQVNGKTNVDFSSIAFAAALSGKDEAVSLKVKQTDGTIKDFAVLAKELPDMGYKGLGILPAMSLEIAEVQQPEQLYEKFGLKAGDVLVAVGGSKVEQYWQFTTKLRETFEPNVSLTFQRPGQTELVQTHLKLGLSLTNNYNVQTNADLGCIYSMVPRLKIAAIFQKDVTVEDNLKLLLKRFGIIKLVAKPELELKAGDIIVKVAEINNPTFLELRTLTNEYGDKYMPITILRDGAILTGEVKPIKEGRSKRFVIGIIPELDIEHSVVAKTIKTVKGSEPPAIPAGAEIVGINNKEISNFYDIIRVMRSSKGKEIKLKYRIADSYQNGSVVFKVPEDEAIGISSYAAEDVSFKALKKLYRAAGPGDAVKIGFRKTVEFIVQTYMTLKGLIVGSISPKSLMGPVGMIAASSRIIAEREFIMYFYFMGLISACLAVMNFLPLPILDGGLVVMLIIEKIKGSPVHVKAQEWLTYAGLAIIGELFIMITYNDIIRVLFNK